MYQILHFQNYKYPWIVSLISNASQPYLSAFCAGTLVASRYVVTAASCVGARLPASVLARLGEHDLRRGEGERLGGVARGLAHLREHGSVEGLMDEMQTRTELYESLGYQPGSPWWFPSSPD